MSKKTNPYLYQTFTDTPLLMATQLLVLGVIEQERLLHTNMTADWQHLPEVDAIAQLATTQDNRLCDAIFLLLDGWSHYQRAYPT